MSKGHILEISELLTQAKVMDAKFYDCTKSVMLGYIWTKKECL